MATVPLRLGSRAGKRRRATDDAGRRQPARISDPDDWRDALADDEYPWNEGGFAANAYEPNAVEVEVEGGGDAMGETAPFE